jgi:hypothetical protein
VSTLALFLVAVNPIAVAASFRGLPFGWASARVAFMATAAVVAILAAASQPVLDWLDVSPPTFQLAAGAVVAIAAARWVAVGAGPPASGEPPSLFTRLLSPPVVAVAVTAGVEVGTVWTTAAAIAVLVTSAVALRGRDRGNLATWSWGARLVGLAGLVAAFALIVDGVKTV